jgi:hypothetical protein
MGFLEYLNGEIGLEQLRKWFAPVSMDLVCSENPDAVRVANAIIGDLSDFDEGFLLEDQLKQNLRELLFPSPSQTSFKHVSFGDTGSPVATSTATVTFEGTGSPARRPIADAL